MVLRAHVLQVMHGGGCTWFVDGAHTPESTAHCLRWLDQHPASLDGARERVLLFGCQDDKDPEAIFAQFEQSGLVFDRVLFCPPGAAYPGQDKDHGAWEHKLKDLWQHRMGGEVAVHADAQEAILGVGEGCDVLVTGSLFLVGKAIQTYAPETLGIE